MAYGTVNADVIGTSVTGSNLGAGNASIMKNRIINGAMVIDQRNAGAAVTVNTGSAFYSVDRFFGAGQATDGVYTLQQAGTGLAGLPYGLKATVTTADASLGATQAYYIQQCVEGFNFADMAWGTASAKTVTLSFWVYSSLTGTFGGSLSNSAYGRSYPFSYSIPVANTWTQISVTIAGDTTGTWVGATNGIGVRVSWALGIGSTYSGTANAWAAGAYYQPTGSTNVMATSGATFYITGVQLEVGSSATGFEYRQYGQELALCQRYYYKIKASAIGNRFGSIICDATTTASGFIQFLVSLRTNPTALETTGTAADYSTYTQAGAITCSAVPAFGNCTTDGASITFAVASGLVTGQAGQIRASNTNTYFAWSAEL